MNKKTLSDEITILQTYGIYPSTRSLFLIGDIEEELAEKFLKNMMALSDKVDTITVHIMSNGGDVSAGRAIYDAIVDCTSHVTIVVHGYACSAASFILQAADHRILMPSAYLMVHVGSEGHEENHPRNIEVWHNFYRKLEDWMEEVYLDKIREKKPRFTRKKVKDLLVWDRIIYGNEALDLGLVDEVKLIE